MTQAMRNLSLAAQAQRLAQKAEAAAERSMLKAKLLKRLMGQDLYEASELYVEKLATHQPDLAFEHEAETGSEKASGV